MAIPHPELAYRAASIAELMAECTATTPYENPAYRAKMLHPIPDRPSVDRIAFIGDIASGQTVLDVGASGALHMRLLKICPTVYGLDISPAIGIDAIDFDDPTAEIPKHDDVQLVICGEILEHLSNPGFLLKRLRATYPTCPLVVSAPNATFIANFQHIQKGVENVNRDHVAWYSPKTLEWLLGRFQYAVDHWVWYNGQPTIAEGIIVYAKPV